MANAKAIISDPKHGQHSGVAGEFLMNTVNTGFNEPEQAFEAPITRTEKVDYPLPTPNIDGYRAEMLKPKPEMEVLGWHARSERLRRF